MDALLLLNQLMDIDRASAGSEQSLQLSLDRITEQFSASAAALHRSGYSEPILSGAEQASFLTDAASQWLKTLGQRADYQAASLRPSTFVADRLLLSASIIRENSTQSGNDDPSESVVEGLLMVLLPITLSAQQQMQTLKAANLVARQISRSRYWAAIAVMP